MNYAWFYSSAFGRYEIPPDVFLRSERLKKYGRDKYLAEWCKWRWMNGVNA